MVVLVQFIDRSCRLRVQFTPDTLELFSAAVAAKSPLGEEFDEVMVAMTGDTARVAESCFL